MDQFPIGCWNYFPIEQGYQGMVRDWHDLGLGRGQGQDDSLVG